MIWHVLKALWEWLCEASQPGLWGYLGRSPQWRPVRDRHIEANPTCAACDTLVDPNAHHIKSFHQHPELELDPANLITLCGKGALNCHWRYGHNAKNWNENNPDVVKDSANELARLRFRRHQSSRHR